MNDINWFKLMWKNGYIFGFIINLFFVVIMIIKMQSIIDYSGSLAFAIGIAIPLTGCFFIAYFGFYRFWKRFKKFAKFYEGHVKKT